MNDDGDEMMEIKLDVCDLAVGSHWGSPLANRLYSSSSCVLVFGVFTYALFRFVLL